MTLTELNWMNCDIVQKCDGYYRHPVFSKVIYSQMKYEKKENFLLLHMSGYLFSMAYDSKYLPRGRNRNLLSITLAGNASVTRNVIPLVTIPFLSCVMIHWIYWIQLNSFRENYQSPWKCLKCCHSTGYWLENFITFMAILLHYYLCCLHNSQRDNFNEASIGMLIWGPFHSYLVD